ncbi:MAG: zinc ABC transporter ATP-binding protein ZnuC [Alphaproteobacteria bacterium]|nr:zinc ABC transporter ATP-binding protein ZnuC [Alphaproteobacteria bacterium]MDP6589133.1 zinc ABC transporter ATP-binding protein ZnuC [Alphaproteobacteria bacterium]MDP6818176.1 zinc ABC transporter ATP-binding protein ZnuC [Alphaproteobacteria bacterium]
MRDPLKAPPGAPHGAPRGSLVSVADLGVRRAGHSILSGVSLDISGNEIVSLIGPNGAGKTTLIRAILGLIPHQEGSIVTAPNLVIGYMPQQFTIDPVLPLTVRRFLRMAANAGRAEIVAALGEVGVPQLAEAQVQTLSGGEFQRLLLARALLRNPDLLVLDEPAQQVDFQGQIDMFELIEGLRRTRGCGVLVVSHDLHMVMRATDRVLCLNGHICCSGAPEAVSAHPEYVALFGPRAAESVALYHHHHRHAHDLAGEILPLQGAPPEPPRGD